MRVDFTRPLMQLMDPTKVLLEGEPPADGEKDERAAITLKAVACNALMMVDPQEKMGGEEKVKRYALAVRIVDGETEFKTEDVALVKKVIGEAYPPMIVGQSYALLEGSDTNEEKVAGEIPAKA